MTAIVTPRVASSREGLASRPVDERAYPYLAATALGAILTGLVLAAADHHGAANAVWAAVVAVLLVPLVWSVLVTVVPGLGPGEVGLFGVMCSRRAGPLLARAVVAGSA